MSGLSFQQFSRKCLETSQMDRHTDGLIMDGWSVRRSPGKWLSGWTDGQTAGKHNAKHNAFITYRQRHSKHTLDELMLNPLRPRQNGRRFADGMFKCIFLNENVWVPIEISLKFVPKASINNNPSLDQIMAWRRPGDNPLSEPMMVSSLTHICVTRPQWVNSFPPSAAYIHQWIGSALACRQFSVKPLSKPMPGYCQLDP